MNAIQARRLAKTVAAKNERERNNQKQIADLKEQKFDKEAKAVADNFFINHFSSEIEKAIKASNKSLLLREGFLTCINTDGTKISYRFSFNMLSFFI